MAVKFYFLVFLANTIPRRQKIEKGNKMFCILRTLPTAGKGGKGGGGEGTLYRLQRCIFIFIQFYFPFFFDNLLLLLLCFKNSFFAMALVFGTETGDHCNCTNWSLTKSSPNKKNTKAKKSKKRRISKGEKVKYSRYSFFQSA